MVYQKYEQFCFEAVKDDHVFENFKRSPIYNEILEHVPKHEGLTYYSNIPDANNFIGLFPDDSIGNPNKTQYGKYLLSPTTLRYIKILCDIRKRFGTIDNFNICEIGIGYGGQFLALDTIFNIKNYTFVDLPGACALTEKYLSKFNTKCPYIFKSTIKEFEYDLVISNFAFTEFPKPLQEEYLTKIVSKAKRGFLILNMEQGFKYKELLERIPSSTIVWDGLNWGHIIHKVWTWNNV
jgi:hypothetical protein